jgi:hypothetical protein
MAERLRRLSTGARVSLVAGLWLLLLVVLYFAASNLAWVTTWAHGPLLACLSIIGVVVIFSLVAAAVEISIETLKGRYPE